MFSASNTVNGSGGTREYSIDYAHSICSFAPRAINPKQNINDQNLVNSTLLERIAAGDEAAVEGVIDQYGDLVWSLARRFCGVRADAEDAVQEIFTDLWAHADRYDRTIAKEVTFVAMVARRRLIDRLRKKKRRPDEQEFSEEQAGKFSRVAENLEESVDVDRVAAVIAGFKEDQKRVLELSLFLGHSHSEIAEKLSMPLGTVKTHLRRGLLVIRDELSGYLESREVKL